MVYQLAKRVAYMSGPHFWGGPVSLQIILPDLYGDTDKKLTHIHTYMHFIYIYMYVYIYIYYISHIKWLFSLNMRQVSVGTWKIAVDVGSAIVNEELWRERLKLCVCVCMCAAVEVMS